MGARKSGRFRLSSLLHGVVKALFPWRRLPPAERDIDELKDTIIPMKDELNRKWLTFDRIKSDPRTMLQSQSQSQTTHQLTRHEWRDQRLRQDWHWTKGMRSSQVNIARARNQVLSEESVPPLITTITMTQNTSTQTQTSPSVGHVFPTCAVRTLAGHTLHLPHAFAGQVVAMCTISSTISARAADAWQQTLADMIPLYRLAILDNALLHKMLWQYVFEKYKKGFSETQWPYVLMPEKSVDLMVLQGNLAICRTALDKNIDHQVKQGMYMQHAKTKGQLLIIDRNGRLRTMVLGRPGNEQAVQQVRTNIQQLLKTPV